VKWLFLIAYILVGEEDMRVEKFNASDLATCEGMRIEQQELLKARTDVVAWNVGKCLTESPFRHGGHK